MSRSHLVLIPSYDTGRRLVQTAAEARAAWDPVWVVIDGSTDDSDRGLETIDVRVLKLPHNAGKGAAIRHGVAAAVQAGFTHVLTMDADGQHPAASIPAFMQASADRPDALVLGLPVFAQDAPALRVKGRRISNWWANLETGWAGIGDSLFGFRVYPAGPLLAVLSGSAWMRRFDFDAEAAVRLCWRGLPLVNIPAPVRYLSAAEGGVSHFHYWRDNVLLTWMHMRLVLQAPLQLLLARLRKTTRREPVRLDRR